jgi:hypothetical protein
VSTCAVHIFLFSKTSNHVSRHYRFCLRTEVRQLPDGPSRSRGTPRFGGPASVHPRLFAPWCRQSSRTSDAPSPPRTRDRPPFGLRSLLRLGLARFHHQPVTGNGFYKARTPSTHETPCEGVPDPDRAVRPEASMLFTGTRRPSARLLRPRGFHRRELVSQTPLISFCNATRPADTSAALRSPNHAFALSRATAPMKDPPAGNRPMRNPISRCGRAPCSSTPGHPRRRPLSRGPGWGTSFVTINQDPALPRAPRRAHLGHRPGAFHHRPRA